MPAAPVVQFIDETVAGETLRDHEVRLQTPETVKVRELLQLRFGDNADRACEAFNQGALRMKVAGAQVDSLDACVHLVPGQAVRLIRLTPAADH